MNAPTPKTAGADPARPDGKFKHQPSSGTGAEPRPDPAGTPPAQTTAPAPALRKPANVPAPAAQAAVAPAPAKPAPPPPQVPPPATRSSFHQRHFLVLLTFFLAVIAPAGITGWYLWTRAADQYASHVGFSVRTEEQASALTSILGTLPLPGSSSASDAEVLYQFIQSQSLVAKIDKKLDLRGIWSKADPNVDPVFAYHPPGQIEDLLEHWERKVKIAYDSTTGLIELRVLAFNPDDAKLVAEEIYAQSTTMINELSAIAREDAIRYAREELNQSVERLKKAREALTTFRNRTQIVDPSVDLASQAGLLSTLNQQLAGALIELDLLKQTTRTNDPRVAQAERKIQVIEIRIDDEKRKLGLGGGSSDEAEAFATLVGEFERLAVDREFAEQTYTAALASYDSAQAEARRQTRYLAAHVRPTLAEKSEYPKRWSLFGLLTLFAFLIWAILVLVAYSLRDRR